MTLIKKTILIVLLYTSTIIAIDAGVDQKIKLGEVAYLKAKASDNLKLTWKINDDTYAYGKKFYFFPETEGIFIIDLFASNGEHDTVKVVVEDRNDTNTTISAIDAGADQKIKLGEVAYLKAKAPNNLKLTWKINNDTYAYGKKFYFFPKKEGIFMIDLFASNGEHDTVKVIVGDINNTNTTINDTNKTIIVTLNDGKVKKIISKNKNIINNALKYVHLHGGGKVYLKAGTFFIDDQLVIFSNTTLEGEVKNDKLLTTIKLKDYAQWAGEYKNGHWFNIPPLLINSANGEKRKDTSVDFKDTSNSNITIKNLIIDGNREKQKESNSPGNGCYYLVYFLKVNNTHFSNVKMINSLSDGITIVDGNNTTIESSIFKNLGHSAIMLIQSNNSIIDNNIIDVRTNSGIRFFSGNNIYIKNNYIFSSLEQGNYGIQISQAYSKGKIMDNVLIENNIIRDVPYAGIALYSNSDRDIAYATIRNNIIYQCGSKARKLSIFSNSVHPEAGGINIQSFKSVKILNNTLFNNTGSGIWLDNRYYIPDDTQDSWEDLDSLDKLDKSAIIKNNIIVGSRSEKKEVYGIEKRFTEYTGTKIEAENNLFWKNKSGSVSDNINISSSKNYLDADPQFENTSIYPNLKVNNNKYKNIGASNTLIQKNNEFNMKYK